MEYVKLLTRCSLLLRLVNSRHLLSTQQNITLDAKISACIKELNALETNFDTSAMLEQFERHGTV